MNYTKKPANQYESYQEKVSANVASAQRSTQDSIRVSGSATDATLIIVALLARDQDWSDEYIKEKWEAWRKFFFEQRDINETFKNLTQPFV